MCALAMTPPSRNGGHASGSDPRSAAEPAGQSGRRADVDLEAVAAALRDHGYEPLVEDQPGQRHRRISLIGHGGFLSTGRVGWLLAAPGRRPRALHDAEGRWVTLSAMPADVARAVAASDDHAPR